MKKIIAMALALVLVAGLSIGGTVAYLSDTDSEVNVMTAGKVKVTLNELQRNDDQTGLEAFEQNKVAVPYVNASEKDTTFNLIKEDSHIDKIVYATNNGNTAAYMRILVAIPSWANTTEDQTNANNNNLHWNYPGDTTSGKIRTYLTNNSGVQFDENADSYSDYTFEKMAENVTIDGASYTVWGFTFKSAVAAGKSTNIVLTGMYLDKRVSYDADAGQYKDVNGATITGFDGTIKVPVLVQAVQATGFSDAATAMKEAFGETNATNIAKWFPAETTTTE